MASGTTLVHGQSICLTGDTVASPVVPLMNRGKSTFCQFGDLSIIRAKVGSIRTLPVRERMLITGAVPSRFYASSCLDMMSVASSTIDQKDHKPRGSTCQVIFAQETRGSTLLLETRHDAACAQCSNWCYLQECMVHAD